MKKATLNLLIALAIILISLSEVRSQDSTAVKSATDSVKTTAPAEPTEPAAAAEPVEPSEPASSSSESNFGFRFTAGPNFSSLGTTESLTESQSEIGYMVGFSGSSGSNIFIEPGIQFVSYVNTLNLSDTGALARTTQHFTRANYIRVPIQGGFRLFSKGKDAESHGLNLEVRLGVSESFLIGTSDHVNEGTGNAFVSDDFESLRTGVIAGLGVQVLFLSLNVEYELGVTNFFANGGGTDTKLGVLYIIFGGSF